MAMLERDVSMEDDVNFLQGLLIIAMAESKDPEFRANINPADYFGMSDLVAMAKSKPRSAIQELFRRTGTQWDGKTPLWQFVVEENRKRFTVDLAVAKYDLGKEDCTNWRKQNAYKIIRYYQEMKCGVTPEELEKAWAVFGVHHKPDPEPAPAPPPAIVPADLEPVPVEPDA